MSLKDTIQGAREEAGTNIASVRSPKGEKGKDGSAPAASSASSAQQGFTRRSASKAKPSRKAAAGVRTVSSSKSKAGMTKEEKKAERKREREKDDLRYNVTQKLLEERPEYKKARKTWWVFLIVGLAFMMIAFIQYNIVSGSQGAAPVWMAFTAMASMVLAYAALIIGLIYDWRTIRPMRKDVDKYVRSMSEKRLITAINKAKDKEKDKGKNKAGKKK